MVTACSKMASAANETSGCRLAARARTRASSPEALQGLRALDLGEARAFAQMAVHEPRERRPGREESQELPARGQTERRLARDHEDDDEGQRGAEQDLRNGDGGGDCAGGADGAAERGALKRGVRSLHVESERPQKRGETSVCHNGRGFVFDAVVSTTSRGR